MAHKKGQGTSRNGPENESKRLGVKKYDGEIVRAENILMRQCGTKCISEKTQVLGRIFRFFRLLMGW
jgi:large subunit ribosomal protein L27